MKIAIDAFRVVCEPRTSGAVYVVELARALAQLEEIEAIYMVVPDRPTADGNTLPVDANGKVRWVTSRSSMDPSAGWWAQIRWVQLEYPRAVRQKVWSVDWLIAPYHQTPVFRPQGWRALAVIHDLCGLRADCGYKRLGKGYWRHWFNFVTAAIGADAVVAISEYTRSEIGKRFPALARKPSQVAYNAVTAPQLQLSDAQAATSALGLPPRFFLAWAAAGPRKGTDLSLKSFAAYRASGGAGYLVMIGGKAAVAEWQPAAEALDLHDVVWLSGISDLVRDALYRQAVALLFPSRCEGFGYPIVEAMRQGCPVIADVNSPAREIVGHAMPLLRSIDVDVIAGMIQSIATMPDEARRSLGSALHQESLRFSGDHLASRYIELMKPSVAARALPSVTP